jgi:hypothetical protein
VNPNEVGDLLRFCSSVDPWLKQTSPEEGAVMVGGWGMLLEAVPADVAMRAARAHYSAGDARTITPGDLIDAWATVRRRDQQADTDEVQRRETAVAIGDVELAPVFGSGAQYLADMMAAVERGEDPATVTRPAGVRVRTLSPEGEARERACRFPDICACTHLECRDGWLDEPGVRTNNLGRSYEAAQKCPQCEDGVLMAIEKGIARKPRRATAAR